MTRFVTVLVTVAAVIGSAWSPAVGQSPAKGLDVTAPAPAPPTPEFGLQPAMPKEQRGSREQEFYPGSVKSRHEPTFVLPFVGTVPTARSSGARVGLSGWTAPAVPFDIPQATGGVAFGLTVVWGVPRPESTPPEPEPTGQR